VLSAHRISNFAFLTFGLGFGITGHGMKALGHGMVWIQLWDDDWHDYDTSLDLAEENALLAVSCILFIALLHH
jgi:hypothetical protein